jgi:predicted phage tail protein
MKINLHGKLGQDIGENWELDVVSVAEAIRAIEANTSKLRKWLIDNLEIFHYEILINNEHLFSESKDFKTIEEIKNSELFLNLENKIQTIDIIPVIVGAGFFSSVWKAFKIISGVALIAAAVFIPVLAPIAIPLVFAGLGLIAAGVSELLAKPPPNVPFTAQQADAIEGDAGGPTSYLFNGPKNTVGEGGPVPIGYGELMIGGHNIMSNYDFNIRAVKTSFDSNTYQSLLFGSETYLFNNRGFLINQSPIYIEAGT